MCFFATKKTKDWVLDKQLLNAFKNSFRSRKKDKGFKMLDLIQKCFKIDRFTISIPNELVIVN